MFRRSTGWALAFVSVDDRPLVNPTTRLDEGGLVDRP
jgi:hypothetical protein